MSAKRLNKRQAREQQELAELAAEKDGSKLPDVQDEVSEDEGSPAGAQPPQAGSIFAALGGEGGDEEAEDDESEGEGGDAASAAAPSKKKKNKKKNKKKKKAAGAGAGADAAGIEGDGETAAASPAAAATPTRQSGNKKQADKVAKGLADMSMDDFDSLLASQPHLANQGAGRGSGGGDAGVGKSAVSQTPATALRSCLSLQQNHLDPSVELKRQFGSAAIKAYEAANGGTSAGGPGAASGARARMMSRNPNLRLRSVLVQPRPDWPPVARTFTGMSGELHDAEQGSSNSGKIATWEHTRAYRAAQYEFQQAVASYDPNNIYALFRSYPWHVHLLSSLSDIAKHQGDLGQASDWNARILFAYERTASPVFTSSLTSPSGPIPVDFNKVENRGLYLAAHRMIAFLGRRGTWRTALEWAKFLLGLDIRDPHACLLWVDFLAIKSRQHKWLVEDFLPRARKVRDLSWAGGIEFAEALGLRSIERDSGDKSGEKSTPALQAAIRRHAYLLPALYSKLGASLPAGMADDPTVSNTLTTADEDSSLREIIAAIYAARNESLWKDADLKEWLLDNVKQVWAEKSLESSPPTPTMSTQDRFSLYRHVLVAEMPDALRQSLTSLIPKNITSDASNLDAFDPLPPTIYERDASKATRIDDEYFAVLYRTGNAPSSQQQRELDERGMMQRLWDLLQGGAGGGGGPGAGANAGPEMAEMAEHVARALREAQGQRGDGGGGGDDEDDEDNEEVDEEGGDNVPGGWGR